MGQKIKASVKIRISSCILKRVLPHPSPGARTATDTVENSSKLMIPRQ